MAINQCIEMMIDNYLISDVLGAEEVPSIMLCIWVAVRLIRTDCLCCRLANPAIRLYLGSGEMMGKCVREGNSVPPSLSVGMLPEVSMSVECDTTLPVMFWCLFRFCSPFSICSNQDLSQSNGRFLDTNPDPREGSVGSWRELTVIFVFGRIFLQWSSWPHHLTFLRARVFSIARKWELSPSSAAAIEERTMNITASSTAASSTALSACRQSWSAISSNTWHLKVCTYVRICASVIERMRTRRDCWGYYCFGIAVWK